MPNLITAIQDAPAAVEVDARTVLRAASEPLSTDAGLTEPEALAAFETVATARAARSYAQLVVQRVDDAHFVLTGQHSDDDVALALGEPSGRPRLSLGELATGQGLDPADLYRLMQVWSAEEYRIIDWIQRLRSAVGDAELRLVIWDTTGFEIPWEIFHLPGAEAPARPQGGPLGGLFAVSRRVTLHRAMDDDIGYDEHTCRGRLVAYVDEEMAADREFLPGYTEGAVGDTDELLDQLDNAPDALGLVYVACHGTFADELSGLLLGGIQYYDIALYPLAALSRSRAAVFLNACHAGRLLWDPRVNREVYGFAKAFLQGGAEVVIAPTGFVETTLAGQIAADVLGEVRRQPDLPLATVLTRVRAKAALRVGEMRRPAEADIKAFIYTFMYVCYGNPYAMLDLTSGGLR
jgi:hypothetical protein